MARNLLKRLPPEAREGPLGRQLKSLEMQGDQAARGMPLPKAGAALLAAMQAAEEAVEALGLPPAAPTGELRLPEADPPAASPQAAPAVAQAAPPSAHAAPMVPPPGPPAAQPPSAQPGAPVAPPGPPSAQPVAPAQAPATPTPTRAAAHATPRAVPGASATRPLAPTPGAPPPSGPSTGPLPGTGGLTRPGAARALPGAAQGTAPLGGPRSGPLSASGPLPGAGPRAGAAPASPSGPLRPGPGSTGPLAKGGASGWVGTSPLGAAQVKASGPLPKEAAAQPVAFDEAHAMGEAQLQALALRAQLLRLGMDAALRPGKGRPWPEAVRQAREAAAGIPAPQNEWAVRLAQLFVESPGAARQAHAVWVAWEQAQSLHAQAQQVARARAQQGAQADPLVAAFPLESYRAALYALGRFHDTVRGHGLLEAFFPNPTSPAS